MHASIQTLLANGMTLQEATWTAVRNQHDALLSLNTDDPRATFGESYEKSFIPAEALKEAACVCIGCMDGRVPSPENGMKLGVAGSGVLMTKMPHAELLKTMTASAFCEYLSDAISGDERFLTFVRTLHSTFSSPEHLTVSDHEGCGAVDYFCAIAEAAFKEAGNPLSLPRKQVGRAAAKRLHTILSLQGEPQSAGYAEDNDIQMNGMPEIHDEFAIVIDLTGRYNGGLALEMPNSNEAKPLRALLLTARYSPSWEYLEAEIRKGREIIAGAYGIGIDPPVLIIGATDDPSFSADTVKENLADALDGTTVLTMTEPNSTEQTRS